ncbi:hypothetical protein LTR93_003221 [Exophiala xenobiotica]|nr:hypothetical protein LTR93_003221 [Exophiala xenobiotica]
MGRSGGIYLRYLGGLLDLGWGAVDYLSTCLSTGAQGLLASIRYCPRSLFALSKPIYTEGRQRSRFQAFSAPSSSTRQKHTASPALMDPKLKRIIELIESKKKSSHPWKRQERHDQPYYTYSPETTSWDAVSPSSTPSKAMPSSPPPTKFSIMSWNIDFMLPFTSERMLAALNHLHSLITSNLHPTIIMLQEMLESDLLLIQSQPWLRKQYNLTDISADHWESGHYGTVTLIPKSLPIASVFRVHYEATVMERDALFVDLAVTPSQTTIRICNTHLESLIANPPKRPAQLATAAKFMHDPTVAGAVLGGDLNAIQDFDRTLHSDNDLSDAYLTLGGREDSDEGYTWGQMAPTKQRQMFGCSRMDKLFFCGQLQCEKFERFGLGIKAEDKHVQESLVQDEGMEEGWVTDHLGVSAEFSIVQTQAEPKI